MDYTEEQNNEIEALQSIYFDELRVLSGEPWVFVVSIKSDNYEDESVNKISCLLKFEFTPTYPEVLPLVDIEETENLTPEDEKELLSHLMLQGEECIGMAMVFTFVSAAQEWINLKSDQLTKEREEKAVLKKRQEEEAERQKFEGTRVTVETFITWKQAFDAEMGLLAKREKEEKNKKLTGRELFMLDKSLNESDLKFLEEAGGEVVQVDESLFQDFDDLEIGDEAALSEED